jgi:hypothetical protein
MDELGMELGIELGMESCRHRRRPVEPEVLPRMYFRVCFVPSPLASYSACCF